MDNSIKHIWFDVAGTLYEESENFQAVHDNLRYETFSKAVNKPITDDLKLEYENLYKKHGSNSAVFSSLGLPSDYWQRAFGNMNLSEILKPNLKVNETLRKLGEIIPISLFTNFKKHKIEKILDILSIDQSWFTHIINGDQVKERKPALDGFHLMVEKSQLPAENILYVGDRVDVDIKPAKQVGMKTCLVYSESPEADYSFQNFEDILSIVE
ncbi:MAG TPA: HAD family hydrolase [Patescibacteria group bacterium]|jgi:FMN phosphatase YigB (HAD superfamily)|nr:HAD family hydrolase [Patescibacteria group bacterium]